MISPYVYLAAALAVAASSAAVTHKIDNASYLALELRHAQEKADAEEKARAEQKRLDAIALEAAQKQNRRQAEIAAASQSQLRKVRQYVKRLEDERGCVPLGVVRLLDAAGHGVDPERLPLPAGKSDDACSGLRADDLARSIVRNYGAGRANAAQLDALIDVLRQK